MPKFKWASEKWSPDSTGVSSVHKLIVDGQYGGRVIVNHKSGYVECTSSKDYDIARIPLAKDPQGTKGKKKVEEFWSKENSPGFRFVLAYGVDNSVRPCYFYRNGRRTNGTPFATLAAAMNGANAELRKSAQVPNLRLWIESFVQGEWKKVKTVK